MGICAALCLSLLSVGVSEGRADRELRFEGMAPHEKEAMAAAGTFQTSTVAIADDASRIQFSIYGGKLYFRNLNLFNPQWEGCCYHYYIDLATDEGKSMYAYFMAQAANRGRIVLWRESISPGPIQQMGNWG